MLNKKKEAKEKRSKKTIIKDILLNTLLVISLVFVAYEIILKFTDNQVYLFGIRTDVVLTNSMKTKNEDPDVQAFLEGHDEQFEAGDMLFSTRVKEDTELKLYDIVIFKERETQRLTIHRIVKIIEGRYYPDKITRYYIRADSVKYTAYDGAYRKEEILARFTGAKIPRIGKFYTFLQSYLGLGFVLAFVALILITDYYLDKVERETKLVKAVLANNNEFPQKYIALNKRIYSNDVTYLDETTKIYTIKKEKRHGK